MDTLDQAIQLLLPEYMTNSGHGHVWPRPDGKLYRCTGTSRCVACQSDLAKLTAAREKVAAAADLSIDPRTGRPYGDHGTANQVIEYILQPRVDLGCPAEDFLKCWREGDLEEWPEYYEWLNKQ